MGDFKLIDTSRCTNEQDFFEYVNTNMEQLGLTPPKTIWQKTETTIKTVGTLLGAIKMLGKGATLSELAFATTALEKTVVGGVVLASGYVGAYVGSVAVAAGRYGACGSTISDTIYFIQENGIDFYGSKVFFANNPEIIKPSMPNRETFAERITVK